jgi:hypothetical protein
VTADDRGRPPAQGTGRHDNARPASSRSTVALSSLPCVAPPPACGAFGARTIRRAAEAATCCWVVLEAGDTP